MDIKTFEALSSEKTLLGTIIIEPDVLLEVEAIIKPTDLYSDKHRLLYGLCWESYKTDGTISLPKLCELSRGKITAFEITELTELAETKQAGISLAKIIKEKAMLRQTRDMALQTIDRLKKNEDFKEILNKTQIDLIDIIKKTRDEKKARARDIIPRIEATMKQNKEMGGIGLTMGMGFLTNAIRAYIPGHLIILGAWTSIGKTTMMWELIKRIFEFNSTGDPKVLVVSTEMTDQGNLLKLIGNYCGVSPLAILDQANRSPETRQRIGQAMIKAASHKLSVVDNLYKWDDIYLKCKKEKLVNGLDVVFIDFIQNMIAPGSIYERMSTLAPMMTNMAKELECTVVALSQLSNEAAASGDLLKFKGAGEIAAACDLGIILERGKEEDGILNRDINVRIKKNRWGPTGHHLCRFNSTYTSIDVVPDKEKEEVSTFEKAN